MANPAFFDLSGNAPRLGPQGHQGQRPVHHQYIPPGPGHLPPRFHQFQDRPNRPLVEVVDIRQEFLSETQMREACTRYELIRFEKLTDGDPYDDEDEMGNGRSAWERVTRAGVQGTPKREIVKEIRRLNAETLDVVQKRADLPLALHRHLDIALNMLTREDLDRENYIWTLVQMDHQLREVIDLNAAMYHDRERALNIQRRPPRSKKHRSSSKRRSSSALPPVRKVSYERMSLTAYFKRSPSQHADIRFLYHEMKRRSFAAPHGGPHQYGPTNAPNGQNIQPRQHINNMQPARPGPPPVTLNRPQGGNKPPVIVKQPQKKTKAPQRRGRHDSHSDSDSCSSSASDNSGSSRSQTTYTTDTRSSRSYEKRRGRNRNRSQQRRRQSRPRESSRSYGLESPMHHFRSEARYHVDPAGRVFTSAAPHPPPHPHPPPPPPIIHAVPVVNADIIRDAEMFQAGRDIERNRRQSPPSPPVVKATASDIERMVDDAIMTERRRNQEARFVEEFGDHIRPIPGSRIVQPGRDFRNVNARFPRASSLRPTGVAGRPGARATRADDLPLGGRGWTHPGRRSPRYDSPSEGEYDSDSCSNSFDDDDEASFLRGGGIQEVPSRPFMPRTTSYTQSHRMPRRPGFGHHPSVNPFMPRHPPRGRSAERTRW